MASGGGVHARSRGAARVGVALFLGLFAASWSPRPTAQDGVTKAKPLPPKLDGCLHCHAGIEAMHPAQEIACVDCHGGNGEVNDKLLAHVQRQFADPGDERVPPPDQDLAWRRFVNPMDLRVVATTCGTCHESQVKRVHSSMHATTAGHLSDGFYEMGLNEKKSSTFSVFAVPSNEAEPGDVKELSQVPAFRDNMPREKLSSHYFDLARKECMQCHLWSEGRAVRGRVGFDGDYRGEGCAACHVPYAVDGLSESGDKSAVRNQPGHPKVHAMTRAPTTDTCASCHYGDASIGLNFRGLSQLPPGAPGGPEIPGTTAALRNRAFYLDDASICPPDIHHEKGMHCIDCHTQNDVMGDGKLYGAMEHAVEISCSDCHGTFTTPATLRTRRGVPLEHLRRAGDSVILKSKVDGREHLVPQACQVVDPKRKEFDRLASEAMTSVHAKLECYTCHAGWNPNFIGFHFDRNESLTQLDLLSGARTKGRVTTQEKIFSTWKSFYAGLNESGRFAPYLTGFSTMGTVRDDKGAVLIDQAFPVTSAGLSGMTMVHHQMHTTRPTARTCVECHRSSATWGLGSANFRLARQLAFVADRRGIEVVALDRQQLAASTAIAKFVMPDVVDLELDCDPLRGFARRVFAAEGSRGIHVLDVSDPTAPRRTQFVATIQPKGLAYAGDTLYVADGIGGLRVFDASKPTLQTLAIVPMFDARSVCVQWPYAYVADGPGGLVIVDIRQPRTPVIAGGARSNRDASVEDAASSVAVLFQYSRPLAEHNAPLDVRTPARLLCAVLDENSGLNLFDATEPSDLERLFPQQVRGTRPGQANQIYRGLVLQSHVDLAEQQGGSRTREGDFAYVLSENTLANGQRDSALSVFDVTDPKRGKQVGRVGAGMSTEMLAAASIYNPPFLQTVLFAPGEQGVFAADASISAQPKQLGAFAGLQEAYVIAVEEFPLDKMLDEAGRPLKDVSHAGSRWLTLPEIERLMLVPGAILGTLVEGAAKNDAPGMTARLFFAQLDADHSGVLDGDELAGAGSSADKNGDGRVLLREFSADAQLSKPDETRARGSENGPFLATRVDPDGDLSRLLDGLNPFEFDTNHDRKLDKLELAKAFFSALDLDGDKGLSVDELSRHPGELRQLRYRGPWAAQHFGALDTNKDGRIEVREFKVEARDFEALDRDRNGFVDLGAPRNPYWEQRGILGPQSEWPTRRSDYIALSQNMTRERVLAAFDADKNGVLSQRELRKRPDLFVDFDRDGDTTVTTQEIDARINTVVARGVEVCPDEFLARWDLDGDGKLSPDELPDAVRIVVERKR